MSTMQFNPTAHMPANYWRDEIYLEGAGNKQSSITDIQGKSVSKGSMV